MKCLRLNEMVVRVPDQEVGEYLKKGWIYTTKSVWKAKVQNNKRGK